MLSRVGVRWTPESEPIAAEVAWMIDHDGDDADEGDADDINDDGADDDESEYTATSTARTNECYLGQSVNHELVYEPLSSCRISTEGVLILSREIRSS